MRSLAHSVGEVVREAPRTLVPPPGAALREYQMVGLQWMVSLYNNHLNGILADEMVCAPPRMTAVAARHSGHRPKAPEMLGWHFTLTIAT